MRLDVYALPLTLAAALAAGAANAAGPVRESRMAECENRWIVIPHTLELGRLAFAYVDPEDGWRLRVYGEVERRDDGAPVARPDLPPERHGDWQMDRDLSASCLTAQQVAALGLPAQPEWLAAHVDTSAPAEHALRWGSHYNRIGAHTQALPYLLEAQRLGADRERLVVELADVYNGTERWSEALALLETAIAEFPDSLRLASERGYAQSKSGDVAASVETYRAIVERLENEPRPDRWEYAQALANKLFDLGHEDEAQRYADLAERWRATPDDGARGNGANAAAATAGGKAGKDGAKDASAAD